VGLVCQVLFWMRTHTHYPRLDIVPPVPSATALKALDLGDEQAYFRNLGQDLQNAGDTFGRVTPLKDYNYATLLAWFRLLDTLDATSNYVPTMAAYYYSQSQHHEDARYIVTYLEEHALRDLKTKWWWMAEAVFLAEHVVKDKPLALRVAQRMEALPPGDIPMWARELPAFIYEQMGEKEAATGVILTLLQHIDEVSTPARNFIYYFLKDRMGMVDEVVQAHLQGVRVRPPEP
jgi:hypothetical protein